MWNPKPIEAPEYSAPPPKKDVIIVKGDKSFFLKEGDAVPSLSGLNPPKEEKSAYPFGMTETQYNLFQMIAKDKFKAMEYLLKVRDKEGVLVPFVATDIHRKFIRTRKKKALVLKCRQIYFTTFMEGWNYLDCVLGEGIRAQFMNLDASVTEDVFDRVHTFHEFFPIKPLLPSPKKSNSRNLSFFNGSSFGASTVRNDSSEEEAKTLGRSCTSQRTHLTEGAYIRRYTTLMSGLTDSIPKNGELVIETTGAGAQGGFYEEFMAIMNNGKEKEPGTWVFGEVSAHFFEWWLHPEYILDNDPLINLGLTHELTNLLLESEEAHKVEMKKNKEVNIEQRLWWRRYWLINKKGFTSDPERAIFDMDREYPATPMMAFSSTSMGFFPAHLLNNRRDYWKGENARRKFPLQASITPDGQLMYGQEIMIWVPPYDRTKEVWENRYCIGADVAGGQKGGDYDAVFVKDRLTNMYVAVVHGHIGPDALFPILTGLGRYYHDAKIAFESNNHGVALQIAFWKSAYTNVYKFNPDATEYQGYGFRTAGNTRNRVLQNLYLKFVNPEVDFRIPYLPWYKEAAAFGRAPGDRRDEAQGNEHDDLIMASAVTEACDSSMPPVERSGIGSTPGQFNVNLASFGTAGNKTPVSALTNGW